MSFPLDQICQAFVADCTRNHPDDSEAQERCQLDCSPSATCEDLLTECISSWSDDWNRRCRDAFHCDANPTAQPPEPQSSSIQTSSPPQQSTFVSSRTSAIDTEVDSTSTAFDPTETDLVDPPPFGTMGDPRTATITGGDSQPTSPSNTGGDIAPTDSPEPSPAGLSVGAKAAIGTVVPVAVILAFLAFFFLFRRRRRQPEDQYQSTTAFISTEKEAVPYLPPPGNVGAPFELDNQIRTTPRGSMSNVGGYVPVNGGGHGSYQIERANGSGSYTRSALGR